jgi:hypothetical protein
MEDKIKLFTICNQMAERDLDFLESTFKVDLGRENNQLEEKDEEYYPQFDQIVRTQAKDMASHYELFYCLEVSIRSIIKDKLESEIGGEWWLKAEIPDHIRLNVKANIKNEIDSAFTQRSDHEIDYTNFGDLGEIVRKNWQYFGDLFNSQKAFNRVMHNLNLLRGPIAHCSPLAKDEIVRLGLSVKDWFRLMG